MPNKTGKPKAKRTANKGNSKRSSSRPAYNIQGGVHAGRDVITGNQTNTYYPTRQTLNVTTPADFVAELQKLKAEIERLKQLPDTDAAAARRLEVVQADLQDAIVDAEKEQPAAQRINNTLDGAKETMEKLEGSITSAVNLGTTLGNLALIASRVFGG